MAEVAEMGAEDAAAAVAIDELKSSIRVKIMGLAELRVIPRISSHFSQNY